MEGGEWVNVTSWVNLRGIDHAIKEETLYSYSNGAAVFDARALAAFESEYNVKITDTQIFLPDGTERTCENRQGVQESNRCIEEYCWCQIESFQDCYCRFGSTVTGDNLHVSTLGFAEKNNCNGATLQNGLINMATVFLFIFGTIIIRRRQNKLIVEFDEDEQTAQDYSVCVLNPPPNAHNPDE